MKTPETVSVLLVEDDDVAAEALMRAFRHEGILNPLTHAGDGIEALAVLRGEDHKEPLAQPFVILLDLRMPRMDGFEFLEALREDPALSSSVVFVMTTSDAEQDIARAYDAHVAGYMVKSEVGKNLRNAIDMLGHYWTAVSLPPA